MKHKAEVDTLTQEHQEEVNALRTAQEAQQAAAQRQVAELQQQLEDREQRLAEAQVGASAICAAGKFLQTVRFLASGQNVSQTQALVPIYAQQRLHAVLQSKGDSITVFVFCLPQVTIQEGRFVILSHQRAEQAIAAHATQLTVDLGEAATELGDVFGRLSSALQVTHGDREALKVSRNTCSSLERLRCPKFGECIFWHPFTAWSGLAADGQSLYHYIRSCMCWWPLLSCGATPVVV